MLCTSETYLSRLAYIEEPVWEEGRVVKVLVIIASVSSHTRDPRIKINNRSDIYWLHAHLDTEREVRSSKPTTMAAREGSAAENLSNASLSRHWTCPRKYRN